MYSIRNLLKYVIKAKVHDRVMPYRANSTDYMHDYVVITYQSLGLDKKNLILTNEIFYGADYEARTRYLNLGKVALYQMS